MKIPITFLAIIGIMNATSVMADSNDIKFPLSKDKMSVVMRAIELRNGRDEFPMEDLNYPILLGDCENPLFREQVLKGLQSTSWRVIDASEVIVKRDRKSRIKTYFEKKTGKRVERMNIRLLHISDDKMELKVISHGGISELLCTFKRIHGKWVLKEKQLILI